MNFKQAFAGVERQQVRLLDAYLARVLSLPEFELERAELAGRAAQLRSQQQQLATAAEERKQVGRVAESIAEFCAQVRAGLEEASLAQKRMLIELLIDCVVVTDEEVEIRYVVPDRAKRITAAFLSFAYRLSRPSTSKIIRLCRRRSLISANISTFKCSCKENPV